MKVIFIVSSGDGSDGDEMAIEAVFTELAKAQEFVKSWRDKEGWPLLDIQQWTPDVSYDELEKMSVGGKYKPNRLEDIENG